MWQSRQRVDGIRIASPCEMDWGAMQGDDRVRFCSACRLHVYNLSAMDVEEAARLISDESADVCVRLYRRRDGTVLTRDCPVGRRVVIRRNRAATWGALAVSAGLALSLHSSRVISHIIRGQAIQGSRRPISQKQKDPARNSTGMRMGSAQVVGRVEVDRDGAKHSQSIVGSAR